MTEYQQADIEMRSWKDGMKDAARILETYPEDLPKYLRWILNSKRLEILAAACIEDDKPTSRQRIGDGVTTEMAGTQLRLSVSDGDGTESIIVMDHITCEHLMRYIRQHVFCREEG